MNIIPNPTLLLLQLLPFAVTFAGLYLILFKPMFAYLEERDKPQKGQLIQQKISKVKYKQRKPLSLKESKPH